MERKVIFMAEKMFLRAEEIAEMLEISQAYAYKLIQQMNRELKERGCIVISGRVDRQYFYDHFYGTRQTRIEEGKEVTGNASV